MVGLVRHRLPSKTLSLQLQPAAAASEEKERERAASKGGYRPETAPIEKCSVTVEITPFWIDDGSGNISPSPSPRWRENTGARTENPGAYARARIR